MDDEVTMHELDRLEAERKLRAMPAEVVETAWVRDAQVEAVIDAVLIVTFGGHAKGLAHARHTGEWAARIAAALEFGPDPVFARRVGVCADVDPALLERIVELRHLASHVREYQALAIAGAEDPRTVALIVATAAEFDEQIAPDAGGRSRSATAVLRAMAAAANDASRPIVAALARAVHPRTRARVA